MRQRKNKPSFNKGERKAEHKGNAPKTPRLKIDLYGAHAVKAALENPERVIHALYATDSSAQEVERLSRHTPKIIQKNDFDRALPQGAVHQGLGITCDTLPEFTVQDFVIQAETKDGFTLLILDQVTDPHNVGAILRSACAFGVNGIVMQKKHAPMLDGVLAKTACGAIEHVAVAYETNLSRSIEELQQNGFFVYGLDERGEDIGGVNFPPKKALVLGAEGPGMRRLVKDHCDVLLRLPMSGPMPSINVSNAAAVALYALSTKS